MKETIKTLKWIFKHSIPVLPAIALTSLLAGILSAIGVYSALLSKSLIDAATSGQTQLVIKWLVVMALIYFIRLGLNIINSLTSTYASTTLFNQIQKKLYVSLTYSEWMSQSQYHSVNLLTRMTSDVSMVSNVIFSTLNSIISLSVTLISSFIALLTIDPFIALFTVIATPIYLLFSRLYGKKLKSIYRAVQDQDINYLAFVQESIQNLMIVKAFCHEEENFKTLDDHHHERLRLRFRSTKFSLISSIIFGTISYFIYFLVYSLSALKLASNQLTFGDMTALLQLYGRVSGPLSSFASIAKQFIEGMAAAERLMEIENLPKETIIDQPVSTSVTQPVIEFENVSFQYQEKISILNQTSFKITSGETIALVGPSGQGKTTIIRLLLSLIYPNEGHIHISNEKLNRNHRHLISYVPQGNTLFTGTIRDNISFGVQNATDEDILEAAKKACAYDFIEKLEQGLDTKIGEKGLGLSEGQAQRIALARTFLCQKPILILDEATSALDAKTEINVLESIKQLPHHPTCIIITHRPKALEICDRVLKLENGYLKDEIA